MELLFGSLEIKTKGLFIVHKCQKWLLMMCLKFCSEGRRFGVRLSALRQDDNKIALSMKVVNQGNGKDLDPNGVQIHQDEQRRKIHIPGSGKKTIQLEAVFNTTCSKCGTRGHLARDCFKSPDGKTYELIPEEEPDIQNQSTKVSTVQEKDIKAKKQRKKKKKHKKEKGNRKVKKNKKQRKRRQKTSSSHSEEPSSGNSDEEQQNKESCHRRKRKHSVSPSSEHRKRLRH
ncbi:nucleolar protein of 40 kDa isoform X2 [Cryptotermes secundus]|uniref:nucleolar protein of 40 kDa isoform X2 n=1 Tax=Cryptotermes secundus TaxID=105785 RepID=UPI001454BA01|nr:nucleolar protein of 40 kDa isoform X2 [Cryptotermes secundus]